MVQALVGCDPEERAKTQAATVVLPEGVSEQDYACVAFELEAYFAGLLTEEAVAFVFDDAASRNGTLRDSVGSHAQAVCGLSEMQVIDVIGVHWLT